MTASDHPRAALPTWVPTAVTASRGVAGPVLVALLVVFDDGRAAFWLFVFAMLTDLIDGWLARRAGSDPEWGALLDPLADKVLTTSAWLALELRGWAPSWLALPHLARDAVISLLWYRFRRRGVVWQSNKVGQIAVSYEGTALGVLLFHGPWNGTHWPTVGVVIGAFSLALTLASAAGYGLQWVRHGPPAPDPSA